MRFLSPQFLPLLWLAVIPVVVYLFRRRSRRVRVSTLLFFNSLAREHRESAWLRRLKHLLSLLLTLIILCAPILALARLVIAPRGSAVRTVVILLDRSASMSARQGTGDSRFDAAKARLRAAIEALPDAVPVALVAYDAHPQVMQPRTTNRRALIRSLDELSVRPIADDPAAALAAAGRIAALETPAEIWHATDTGPTPPAGPGASAGTGTVPAALPAGVTRRAFDVGLGHPSNAGLTALSVKKVPLLHSRYQVYVQAALNGAAEGNRTVVLEPQIAGLPLARRELTLAPGDAQGLTLDLEAAEEQVLEITLDMPGDQLALDNRAVVRLPAPRPLTVAWFTGAPDPFTELALKSMVDEGAVEVFTGGPDQWPPARAPDVAVFDGWLPEPWPADLPAVVINPSGSAGPVRALRLDPPVPRDQVRVVDDRHPVLFRVSTARVSLTQTAVLDAAGSLQPLWLAGDQAVLVAGESGGQRVVVLGAAPSLSEHLPLTPSYPLLLGNAVFWCAEKSETGRAPRVLATGSFIEASGGVEWRELRADALAPPVVVPDRGNGGIELDRPGLWRTLDGTREGSSLLLSRHETDLGAGRGAGTSGGSDAPTAGDAPLRGDLTRWFIALALLALVIESWLFHRHAVG